MRAPVSVRPLLDAEQQIVPASLRSSESASEAVGMDCLIRGSPHPHSPQAAFDDRRRERQRDLLHQSPRTFGQRTSVWTLELDAEVSFDQGLTATRVSHETIRAALRRLGVGRAHEPHLSILEKVA